MVYQSFKVYSLLTLPTFTDPSTWQKRNPTNALPYKHSVVSKRQQTISTYLQIGKHHIVWTFLKLLNSEVNPLPNPPPIHHSLFTLVTLEPVNRQHWLLINLFLCCFYFIPTYHLLTFCSFPLCWFVTCYSIFWVNDTKLFRHEPFFPTSTVTLAPGWAPGFTPMHFVLTTCHLFIPILGKPLWEKR